MALIVADRVLESTTTTGTGPFQLLGSIDGYQPFADVCTPGDTCYCTVFDVSDTGIPDGDWASGLATYSAGSLALTVQESSNGGAAVAFGAGTKYIILSATAGYLGAALGGKSDTSHTHGTATAGAAGFMSAADKTKLDGLSSTTPLYPANNLSDLANAATARTNLGLGSASTLTTADIDERARDALGTALVAGTGIAIIPDDGADTITVKALEEWAPNFTAAGDVYIPAVEAMTISQGNAAIGTGTLAFAKSTAAAPSTFNSTTLPATLETGAWLKVSASAVTGFVATHLRRTA